MNAVCSVGKRGMNEHVSSWGCRRRAKHGEDGLERCDDLPNNTAWKASEAASVVGNDEVSKAGGGVSNAWGR